MHEHEIRNRLDRLERENRMLKRVGGLVAAVTVAVVVGAASGDDPVSTRDEMSRTLQVRQLEILSASGMEPVAVIRAREAGEGNMPGFRIDDPKGRPIAVIGADELGGVLTMWNSGQHPIIALAAGRKGGVIASFDGDPGPKHVAGWDQHIGSLRFSLPYSTTDEPRGDLGMVTKNHDLKRDASLP